MATHSGRHGMALVLALVAVMIISVLLSGIMLLSVSHYALSNTNSDYANALNLAEAGINWELNKISRDATQADNSPVTVEVPTASGRSFQVHVEAYPNGGTWNWASGSAFWAYSTGTVDGVSRTVRVVARGHGLFGPEGKYALFGIDTLNSTGNLTVIGAAGTNGIANVGGSSTLDGNFFFCGTGTGTVNPKEGPDAVINQPLPEYFPTVDQLADQRALYGYGISTTQGIDFFKTHNSNTSIVDSEGKNVVINQGHPRLDNNTFKNTTGTIVLGPGDYYFESLTLPSNNAIIVDNSTGVVNIWLGPSGGTGGFDSINGTMSFVSHDIQLFNLYIGSKREFRMNGTMDFYGNVFAYNGPDDRGQYYGSIKVLGDGYINGSVIGYDVEKTQGNAIIEFPSTGGGGPSPPPGEPVYYYGFDQDWEEINPA